MAKKETVPKEIAPKEKAPKKAKVVVEEWKPSNINEALFAFQGESITIPRNGTGKVRDITYKYATLDDTMNAIRPALQKFGIMLTQIMDNNSLITKLIHVKSGTEIVGSLPLGSPTSSQDLGSRITYLRRYAANSMLGLVLDDDVDGTQANPDKAPVAPPVASKPAEFGVFGEQNAPKPEAPKVDAVSAPAPAVQQTLPTTAESVPYTKAKAVIESCKTLEALELVKNQIAVSTKLNAKEINELMEIIILKKQEMK